MASLPGLGDIMQIRTVAAITNGSLVLALYLAAWGAPSLTIAGLELALAAGAAAATWYALDLRRPSRLLTLVGRLRTDKGLMAILRHIQRRRSTRYEKCWPAEATPLRVSLRRSGHFRRRSAHRDIAEVRRFLPLQIQSHSDQPVWEALLVSRRLGTWCVSGN